MDTKKTLGNHIKKLRVERKMSQRRFSLMVNVDRTFLSKIERGRQNISVDTLDKIAAGLDMTAIDLFKSI
jgi:transcriptional regulator with XRE-family HTH domain